MAKALSPLSNSIVKALEHDKLLGRVDIYKYMARDFDFVTLLKLFSSATWSLFQERFKKDSSFSFRFRFRRRFFAKVFEKKLCHLTQNWEKSKSNLVQAMTGSHDLEKHLEIASEFLKERSKIYFFKNFVIYLLRIGLKDLGFLLPDENLKKLSIGHARNFTTQMALDFADERITYDELMIRYGHLTDTWDLRKPILLELSPLPRNFHVFKKIKEDLKKRRQERLSEVEKLRKRCDSDKEFMSLISYFEELILIDQEVRAFSSLQCPEIKNSFKTLENKFHLAAGDIYFLSLEEVQSGQISLEKIEARRREYKNASSNSTTKNSVVRKSRRQHLNGECVSTGVASGRALVVESIEDLRRVKEDSILILRSTLPTYAPYYPCCRGIVSERGGVLSHGAIVAREFSIPLISGVADAFEYIREGDLLEVDANRGVIKKLQMKSNDILTHFSVEWW